MQWKNKAQEGEDREDINTDGYDEREIEEDDIPDDDELVVWFFLKIKFIKKNWFLCTKLLKKMEFYVF